MSQTPSPKLLPVVLPSRGSSPECPWLDNKGEFLVHKILTVLDRMEPMEEIPDDCFLPLPPIDFTHNMSLGAAAAIVDKVARKTIRLYSKKCHQLGHTQKDCSELLHLLHQLRQWVAPCLTDTWEYKEVTEPILEQLRQQRQTAPNPGNTACARHSIWAATTHYYRQVARLTSLMFKQHLMN
ncbi:uncharacterized protein LOC116409515 [Xenopus tropicalis]|uniref:IFN 1.7 n=1 Tax=Xenopus tropicalis TaxID=8364 RepID=A0A1B1FFQ4_XENTR|nr:uncharacterized protein LOC116409515 [Xenopus tropicalis]ANQ43277.1 type I interferon 15 [Xenopus tropicalis]AWK27010.1 IFN 1.7 [Xenopus tropicalis]